MNADLDMVEPGRSTFPTAAVVALATRLVLFAGALWLGFALFHLARPRFVDGFFAVAIATSVPLLLLGGSWLAREAWRRRVDLRALRRFEQGQPPTPGAWVAVAGTAQAHFEPFEAPLSQRPALACRYRVMDRPYRDGAVKSGNRSSGLKLRLEGYHLVPTVIETPSGRIHLLAFPELRNIEKSHLSSGTSGVEDTALRGPSWPASILARGRIFSQKTDRIAVDWHYGKVEQPGLTQRLEWVLEPGAEVCAMGRWSPTGGLLPHWSRASGISVYAGPPAAAAETMRSEGKVFLAFAAIALLGAAALIAWVA
jgi:hypothetical protein